MTETKTTCDDPRRLASLRRRADKLDFADRNYSRGHAPGQAPDWTFNWHDDRPVGEQFYQIRRSCHAARAGVVLAARAAWQRDDAIRRLQLLLLLLQARRNAAFDGHYQFSIYRGWVDRVRVLQSQSPAIMQYAFPPRDLRTHWYDKWIVISKAPCQKDAMCPVIQYLPKNNNCKRVSCEWWISVITCVMGLSFSANKYLITFFTFTILTMRNSFRHFSLPHRF